MRKIGLAAFVGAVLIAVSSCGEKVAVDTSLLGYIPSDASAVVVGESLAASLETIFSPDDVFRALRPGKLSDENAVVSFHYGGNLSAMLAISAGRPSEKPSEAVSAFCRQVDSLGLISMYIPAEPRSGTRNILLVCESQSLIASVTRHLTEGASILDAPGIAEALSRIQDKGQTIIVRNSAASQFLGRDFLEGSVRRGNLLSFVDSFSKWTVLHVTGIQPAGRGELVKFSVDPVCDETGVSFSDYLASLEPSQSRIAEVLPYGTNYAVSLPIASAADFLEARKRYLDSTGGLNRFNVFCKVNRTAEGWDPQRWATAIDVKEVGRIKVKGESLLLLRPEKMPPISGIAQNPWKGYCGVLFGDHFKLLDESYCARCGEWIVIGPAKAVVHFVDSPSKGSRKDIYKGNCRVNVVADDIRISWKAEGIEMEMYKTY